MNKRPSGLFPGPQIERLTLTKVGNVREARKGAIAGELARSYADCMASRVADIVKLPGWEVNETSRLGALPSQGAVWLPPMDVVWIHVLRFVEKRGVTVRQRLRKRV